MTATAFTGSRLSFDLPSELEASAPPEARGLTRDGVRMLVTQRQSRSNTDSSFVWLPTFLEPGDLLVINTSATIPAALDATEQSGNAIVVHLSTQLDDGRWVIEPRHIEGSTTTRWSGTAPTNRLTLVDGSTLTLNERFLDSTRLWIATFHIDIPVLRWLAIYGRPIRYHYVERTWPIDMYQNVYSLEPGSAEMPSAGRAFTHQMITRLVAKGVDIAPITLHTGVASLEADELPYPEHVVVNETTAAHVNLTRSSGHRVIAVGTTAVRALESSVGTDNQSHGFDGWTDLVISPDRELKIVDGLLTGWHEPESSHLMMLEALLDHELLADSYATALAGAYRWHEFGDLQLILP